MLQIGQLKSLHDALDRSHRRIPHLGSRYPAILQRCPRNSLEEYFEFTLSHIERNETIRPLFDQVKLKVRLAIARHLCVVLDGPVFEQWGHVHTRQHVTLGLLIIGVQQSRPCIRHGKVGFDYSKAIAGSRLED